MALNGISMTKKQIDAIAEARSKGEKRIVLDLTPAQRKAYQMALTQEQPEREQLQKERRAQREAMAPIAEAIRNARRDQDMSLAQLSERTGMSPPALSRIETGKNVNPTLQTLQTIAEALGLRLEVSFRDAA